MKESYHNRTKLITLRLTPLEYEQLTNKFKATTCRKLSDYLRKMIFSGKVIILTRSQSLDDFMAEMIGYEKSLMPSVTTLTRQCTSCISWRKYQSLKHG